MTPDKARDRLALSRKTLNLYVAMNGTPDPAGLAEMIGKELPILRAIGEDHPDMADEVAQLCREWAVVRGTLLQRAAKG